MYSFPNHLLLIFFLERIPFVVVVVVVVVVVGVVVVVVVVLLVVLCARCRRNCSAGGRGSRAGGGLGRRCADGPRRAGVAEQQ